MALSLLTWRPWRLGGKNKIESQKGNNMPVQHMVWIKFREEITEARQEEHLAGLRSLESKIPGILHLSVGKNFTDRAQGFTHGLLVTLQSKEALEVYAPHPEHVAVAGPLREDAVLMAMDFEF
ncbi:MAG: stress protein [Phycisphaeraceae bacterium]|nr:stress protein [Phycisphaeraceae bacterium]